MSHAANLEGLWEMIRAEMAGEEAPELLAQKTEVEMTPTEYIVRFDGQVADRGSYELGGTIEVRTMILRGAEGPNAGRTIPCIYQLVGDRMRICYGLDSVTPTEFATTEGDHRYLATYRRKPPA